MRDLLKCSVLSDYKPCKAGETGRRHSRYDCYAFDWRGTGPGAHRYECFMRLRSRVDAAGTEAHGGTLETLNRRSFFTTLLDGLHVGH